MNHPLYSMEHTPYSIGNLSNPCSIETIELMVLDSACRGVVPKIVKTENDSPSSFFI